MWKTTIWNSLLNYCHGDSTGSVKLTFSLTNPHLLLLPLSQNQSPQWKPSVLQSASISTWESCACSLLGSYQKGVFSTGVSAQLFPVCSLHPGLSWQPLHLFCCLVSQLPPCFIENAFFYFLCWFFNDL